MQTTTLQATLPATEAAPPAEAAPVWPQQLLLAVCVFTACLVGIATRPANLAATLWPTNALLVGLLLRNPTWARRASTWGMAWLGYCAADLMTGGSPLMVLGLNSANLASVFCGWFYLRRHGRATLGLRHPRAVLHILVGATAAAFGGALLGGPMVSLAFNTSPQDAIWRWICAELFDQLLILPLILAAPRDWCWHWTRTTLQRALRRNSITPLLALLASEVLTYTLQGPGSIGFSVPALVWCAMTYGVFAITVLNLVLSLARLAATSLGLLTVAQGPWMVADSFFIGTALISLAPLAVAVALRLTRDIFHRLQATVDYDYLTGALSRRALMQRGAKQLQRLRHEGAGLSLVLMDLDHFKHVNDTYGHAQGDVVLRHFTSIVLRSLRSTDMFGRIGGEEFVLLLPHTGANEAHCVAERIRLLLREHPFNQRDGGTLRVSVSMGLRACASVQDGDTLEKLLAQADIALYQAKAAGRDQVCHYTAPTPESPSPR